MIPKKIHYCWFGGKELPKLAKKCIASWQKYCPDYEIIRWDESNFDLDQIPYIRWCYDHNKWAFLSDYVRLAVVAEQGGVYLDTDVELVRPLDSLLQYDAFFGFENDSFVNTGHGFGAMPHHPTVEAMRQPYLQMEPGDTDQRPLQACPGLNTAALLPFGLRLDGSRQTVAGAEILPADVFNPYDAATGRLNKTANTVAIHWYSQSWISKGLLLRSKLTRPFHRIFGADCFRWIKKEK